MQVRTILTLGAASGFLSVMLGAFAAHGLKTRLDPSLLTLFHTGVDYQALHALALLICGLWAMQHPCRYLSVAAWAFALGTLVFSGSLYLLALTGERWIGAITPIGGIGFLVGWASLAATAWRLDRKDL